MSAIPSVRSTDPLSSFLAAQQAEKFKPTHADRILFALIKDGPATAHRLEALTGLTVVQIDRRTVEMQRDNLIRVVKVAGVDLILGGARVWEAV